MRLSEIYVKEVVLKEFWKELDESMVAGYDQGLNRLLDVAETIIFEKFKIQPKDKQYFIAGSARLFIYPKLKEAFGLTGNIGDLDIVIPNKQLWINAGLENEWNANGIYRPTSDGSIEAFNIWDPSKAGGAYADVQVRSTAEVMNDCSFINGYWFMSLMDVMDYKTSLNRDKEKEVVELIDRYRVSNKVDKQVFLRGIVRLIGLDNTKKFIDAIKK
jgi:hypothetical protein